MISTKRVLTALVAGAVALPLMSSPALAAPGDTPIPAPQRIQEFCTNAINAGFTDVVQGGDANANELFLAINCLNTATTTTAGNNDTDVIARGNPGTPSQPRGIGADKYGPQLNVTRGQMASFIARMIDAASVRERTDGSIRELPAPAAGNPFPGDVPNNYTHLDNIKRLTQAGIVNGNPGTAQQPNGIGANRYGPDLPVTRSQMASFINRAVAYATGGNPANAGTAGNGFAAPNAEYYVDAQQQTHVLNVRGITSAGISNGVGGKRYDGLGNVTRQQMARFIARTLSVLFDDQDRIFNLLESYTTAVTADSRGDQNVAADGSRIVGFEGLNPATEYRVTLVKCGNVNRDAFGRARFTVATGGFADTGNPSSRFTGIGFGQSGDAFTPPVATTTVTGQSAFSLRIENPSGTAECVVAVIYVNGGPTKSLSQGGTSPRLEVDADGYPREFFGITGRTTFAAAQQPQQPADTSPIIVDAFVATDAAMATDNANSTGTASRGDVFQIVFNEAIATDAAMSTATATFQDAEGDRFTVQCTNFNATLGSGNTAANCAISSDGRTLTITLTADPVITRASGTAGPTASFPLTITAISGFRDADGNPVNLARSTDTTVNRDGRTQDTTRTP